MAPGDEQKRASVSCSHASEAGVQTLPPPPALPTQMRRRSRSTLWVLGPILLVLVGLLSWRSVVDLVRQLRFVSDTQLLKELAEKPLPTASAAPAAAPAKEGLTEWPQWRGPNRDGVSPETGLLVVWPAEGPKELWRAKTGVGYSCVAVSRGRVYTLVQDGDSEAVVCWEADTGKELWRFKYPCEYVNDFGSGPRSTPTVGGEHVWTVGATGIFHCLKAETGQKEWRHDLLEEFKADNLRWGVSFSPLIEGDLVITNPGGPNGNSIVAFDKRTGKVAWHALDDLAGYSSPMAVTMAGKRQLIVFTGKNLVSVSPQDGKLFWSYPWETSYDCNIATPIAVGDYLFISSGYGKGCALLKVSGKGDTVEVQRVYEHNRMCNHFSSSVYFKEHIYGFNDAVLTCLDFRTGKALWKESGFRKGSLTIADGHLFILGEDGKLALATATPDRYEEKARFRFSGNRCWTVPVVANGKLYVRDEETLVCYDIRKK